MPIHYGVLKGTIVAPILLAKDKQHLEIKVKVIGAYGYINYYRISVNIKSNVLPSDVLYYVGEDFNSYQINYLQGLEEGFTPINIENRYLALDYIRGHLFDPKKMQALPNKEPGPDNDLHEKLSYYLEEAIKKEAVLYAFGEPWGPDRRKDDYFHFYPGKGVHNIHMNQGSRPPWDKDNGIWQDGGLLIQHRSERWVGVFLAFQSQSWNTDNHGNVI